MTFYASEEEFLYNIFDSNWVIGKRPYEIL